MKSKVNIFAWALLMAALVAGCKKEDNPVYIPAGPFSNGVFISNEGTFGLANASVSFYDYAGDSVRNAIFQAVNNHALGRVLQSIYTVSGKVFMVLNLSDTVAIASANDFKEAGHIAGLGSPRYMTSYADKGYITQWGEGGVVKVVSLNTFNILKTIDVGTGPEQVILANGKIMACNGGGYDRDSTITVIDPSSDQVVQTVTVGDNPKELTVDMNNNIWVLCYGYIKYDGSFNIIEETPSRLVRLSGQPLQKTGDYIISANRHPQHLDISKDRSTIFYGGGFGFAGIYAMDIHETVTPSLPLVDGTKYFYGFNVNPRNGEIYAMDATDFSSPGFLCRYSSQGNLIGKYTVGVSPNGAIFR